MKRLTSVLVIFLLLMLGFGTISVNAYGEEPREYNSFVKGAVEYVPDEIIVKFKHDTKPFQVVKIQEGKVKEKIAEYSHRPDVVYAEPNYYAQAFSDDPLNLYQWNFRNETEGGIRAEQAWGISTAGEGVIVAIVDTGIAYENYLTFVKAPDLANTAFVPGYDFVNKDSHANDDNSHGTHVAGTVAQSTNNGIGVAGIAYNAKLMPVKVLDKGGYGTYDNIALGIRWAADNGAKVINLSLGGPYPSPTLEDALAYAYGKGVTIVAAAGNDGASTVSYPAAYDNFVIAVGATRYDKILASYSNYGTALDIVAPGGDMNVDQNGDGFGDGILQNTFNPTTKKTKDFGYWFFQGTSMATPHVAGVAALLIANGNATTPSQVQSALQETALDLGTAGWDPRFGWGLVDVCAAISWGAEPNTAPVADNQSVTATEDTPSVITLTGTDPDGDPLSYSIVNNPTHGSLSGTAPVLTYTPSANYFGSDGFTFRVYDGKLYSETATVSITVNPINDPPVAADQSVTTLKDAPCNITLKGIDVDGDQLTYSIDLVPENGTLSGAAPDVTYTPNTGYIGSDSFTYTVSDGKGGTDSATVTITVEEVPTIQNVNVSINMATATKTAGKNIFEWAIATVSVGDIGAPAASAAVAGHWEGATVDTDLGITNSSGTVSLLSDQVKVTKSPITFTFVVDEVTINGVKYVPAGEPSDSITG